MRGLPVALAGVLTGFWLGLPPGGETGAMPAAKTEPGGGRNRAGTAAAKESGRTYAALIRQRVLAKGLPEAALRSIESATNQELRDMLLAIMVEELPGQPSRPGPEKQRAALNAAAEELFRREGVKSLEWAAEVENFDLSLALMTAAAGQDPALMKEWNVKLGAHWEPRFESMLIGPAKQEAALRSAEDLLAVETLFPDSLAGSGGFADGFDFHAYLKATRDPFAGETAYGFWAAQDPEAATEGLREVLAANPHDHVGRYFLLAMGGRAKMTNEAEATEWIGGVVADLTGQTRDGAIRGLVDHRHPLDLMRHLPSDDDRVTFVAASLLKEYSFETAAPILKALPSQAVQAAALGRWAGGMGEPKAAELDEVMESLDFPEDQREVLRAKLPQYPH